MRNGTPVQVVASMLGSRRASTGRLQREPRCDYGLIALAVFGFLGPQGHAGAKFGLLLLCLVALVYWRRFLRDVTRDSFFRAWCVLTVYVLARSASAALELPSTSSEQWESALHFVGTGFFVVLVSWWLDADTKRVMLLAGAAVVGYCVEVLVELDPGQLDGVVAGAKRNILGVALPMGLVGAIAIIGLLVFLPRFLRHASRQHHFIKITLYSAIMASAALLMLVQIVTQSRAIVGMLIVLVPIIIAWQLFSRWNVAQERGLLGIAYGGVLGLFVAAIMLVGPGLANKFEREYDLIAPHVISGDLTDMPESSLGWRIHLTSHGSNLAAQRPWIGWGPGTSSTRDLADRYDAANLTFLSHLHNTYLEILVRLGSVGAFLYLIAVGLLLRNAIRSRPTTGSMPSDVGAFLLGGGALMAGWSLVDFRMLNWDFVVPLVLLAALAHTFGARWRNSWADRE